MKTSDEQIEKMRLVDNKEIWACVPWGPAYEVSSLGNVRRVGSVKKLSQSLNHRGYPMVSISVNGRVHSKPVHRLMVDAFLGGLPKGMVTNHINAEKTDNRLTNIEIVTPKENTQHRWKTGTMIFGENCKQSKIDEIQAITILTLSYKSILYSGKDLASLYGVHPALISQIRRGKTWKHLAIILGEDFVKNSKRSTKARR